MKMKSLRSKENLTLGKGAAIKMFILPAAIMTIALSVFLFWKSNNYNATAEHIEYIRSFMTTPGKLNDFQNKLGMHDPETDIKWFREKDEIRIEYGRIILTWLPEEFFTEETQEQLGSIGFSYDIKKIKGVQTFILYYNGKEIERWVE